MPDELRSAVAARLRTSGSVFAEEEADLLLACMPSPDALEVGVRRRVRGEPLEHVLGWAAFAGLRVAVAPGVFVPRRRTELLVQRARAVLRPGQVVVDLCCGSGAVGAALAAAVQPLELHLADIDPVAVRCARQNLADRAARVHEGDLYEALPPELRGRVDVLVVNAPYVPSGRLRLLPPEARDHEPAVALDGGPDGLEVHGRVLAGAGGWLAPGGWLLLETSTDLAAGSSRLARLAGLRPRIVHDEALGATVVVATRRPPGGARGLRGDDS